MKELAKLKEAELSYRKAIEINPDYAEAHFNLGNLLKELGKLKEAKLSVLQAIKIKPNLAQAHHTLSILYSKENDYKNAYKEIKLAIKYDSENHIYQGELTRLKFICNEIC